MQRGLSDRWQALVAAMAVSAVAVACSGDDGRDDAAAGHAAAGHAVGGHAGGGAPDQVVIGPQGREPQFVAECGVSHVLADDPIVHPGQPGASHLHTFFGNVATTADASYDDLIAAGTTCATAGDTAAYWVPALMSGRTLLEPLSAVAYYRAGPRVDPMSVEAYPPGLMMLAGDAAATAAAAQPLSLVAWSCGAGSVREVTPPLCPTGLDLRLLVTFPDCWDGENVDSADHRAHVAFSNAGQCPRGHPRPIPQLQLAVDYPNPGDGTVLSLASGGLHSAHADFWNTWDQERLVREVRSCLHREVVCGVAGG